MIFFSYKNTQVVGLVNAVPANKLKIDNKEFKVSLKKQTTSDLGFEAASFLLDSKKINKEQIGVLIFLSKTPDYRGPATAMVLQHRLGIPMDCIVYDAPNGNAGFEQGLNLGASLLQNSSKRFALVIVGDTISKQLNKKDLNELNFQDGATAILLENNKIGANLFFGVLTLSDNWKDIMVPSGGFKNTPDFFDELTGKRLDQLKEHFHINVDNFDNKLSSSFSKVNKQINKLLLEDQKTNFVIIVNFLLSSLENSFKAILTNNENTRVKIILQSEIGLNAMASTSPSVLAQLYEKNDFYDLKIITLSLGEGLSINMAVFDLDNETIMKTIATNQFFENGQVSHEM